jgi:hypothetical protein
LAALAISLLVISVFGLSFWINAFIKLPAMKLPYEIFFICILFGLSLVYLSRVSVSVSVSMLKGILYGALAGQLASFVSLTIANFFIPNGVDRTMRSFRLFGVVDVLLLDFWVAFILGGWLIGGILFLIYGLLARKFASTEM